MRPRTSTTLRCPTSVRRAVPFVLSVTLHVLVGWAAVHALALVAPPERADVRRPIAFTLEIAQAPAPVPAPSIDAAPGRDREGLVAEAPRGVPDESARGRAGLDTEEHAAAVHARGETAREQLTAQERARALADELGGMLRAIPGPRLGVVSIDPSSASHDETMLGLHTRGSRVAPGERGLDMVGTGHGSGPAGDRAGTLGDHVPALGSIGASAERSLAFRGARRVRGLCIIEGPCPPPHRRLVVAMTVLSGPLDVSVARRALARSRAALGACLGRHGHATIAIVVGADGRVAASHGDVEDACFGAALEGVRFPAAAAPSRAEIVVQRLPR